MASRDLFPKFSQARENIHPNRRTTKYDSGVSVGLTDSDTLLQDDIEAGNSGEGAPPPPWMKYVDHVNANIAQLEADVRKLAKAQAAQLRPSGESFFIQADDSENDIERLNANISQLFGRCNELVKKLSHPDLGSEADLKVRKNVQMALAGKLQELSCTFRKKHKQYLQQLSDLRRKTDNLDNSFQFDSSNHDDDDDQGWSQEQLQEIDLMGSMIDERDVEIKQIVSAISELSSIFRELSVLVVDSGTILDRIDYNMELVVDNFEAAEVELIAAEKYTKRSPATVCIVVMCLMNIVMVIIMILKQLAKADNNSDNGASNPVPPAPPIPPVP